MPRDVVRVMVEDHPLAVDGEDYNLQVEVRKIQSCVFIQSLGWKHLHEKRILGFPVTFNCTYLI